MIKRFDELKLGEKFRPVGMSQQAQVLWMKVSGYTLSNGYEGDAIVIDNPKGFPDFAEGRPYFFPVGEMEVEVFEPKVWRLWAFHTNPKDITNYPDGAILTYDDSGAATVTFEGTLEDIINAGYDVKTSTQSPTKFAYVSKTGFSQRG